MAFILPNAIKKENEPEVPLNAPLGNMCSCGSEAASLFSTFIIDKGERVSKRSDCITTHSSPLSAVNHKQFFRSICMNHFFFPFCSVLCTSGMGFSLLNHITCCMGPGDKHWLHSALDWIVYSVIEPVFSTEALSFESHLIRLWHSPCTNYSLGVSLRSTLKSLVTSFMDCDITQAQSSKLRDQNQNQWSPRLKQSVLIMSNCKCLVN